jgi:hypothetical protein
VLKIISTVEIFLPPSIILLSLIATIVRDLKNSLIFGTVIHSIGSILSSQQVFLEIGFIHHTILL